MKISSVPNQTHFRFYEILKGYIISFFSGFLRYPIFQAKHSIAELFSKALDTTLCVCVFLKAKLLVEYKVY